MSIESSLTFTSLLCEELRILLDTNLLKQLFPSKKNEKSFSKRIVIKSVDFFKLLMFLVKIEYLVGIDSVLNLTFLKIYLLILFFQYQSLYLKSKKNYIVN